MFSRLLDILAARKDPRGLQGTILIDGNPQPTNFKCMSGYVSQVSHKHKESITSVIGQIMCTPIRLQCMFSIFGQSIKLCAPQQFPICLLPIECEADGEHCLNMRGLAFSY